MTINTAGNMVPQEDDGEPPSPLSIDLIIHDDHWRWLASLEPKVHQLLRRSFDLVVDNTIQQAEDIAELTLVLTNNAEVHQLNKEYRDKDRPTNVLSFASFERSDVQKVLSDAAAGGPPALLGDIFIAYETCEHEAKHQGKSVEQHVAHLMVHGILHLMGFDHICDTEAEEMENLERQILKEFGIEDPYKGER